MWDRILENIIASSIVLAGFLIIMVLMYYLISYRNIQKSKNKFVKIHEELKPGLKVEFAGGLYGIVRKVHETTCEIEIAKETILTVSRYSISRIVD